jgi:hypothetical protein
VMVSAISSAIENRAFLNNSKAIGSWMAVMALSPSTAGASRWHHPFAGAHTTLSGHKSPLCLHYQNTTAGSLRSQSQTTPSVFMAFVDESFDFEPA